MRSEVKSGGIISSLFNWVRKPVNAIIAIVTAVTGYLGFTYDNSHITVTFPNSDIENHAQRNVVILSNSNAINIADIPFLPEIKNNTKGTVNDLSLYFTVLPLAGSGIGFDISNSDQFSINGDNSQLRLDYLKDKLAAFDVIPRPFGVIRPRTSETSCGIKIFCTHKGIKEAFVHEVNLYFLLVKGKNKASWDESCDKVVNRKFGDGYEICRVYGQNYEYTRLGEMLSGIMKVGAASQQGTSVSGQATSGNAPAVVSKASGSAKNSASAAPSSLDAAQSSQVSATQTASASAVAKPAPASAQVAAPAPVKIAYSFGNPDITFTFKKCVCSAGSGYVDLLVMNNSDSSLSPSMLSEEPCAGYEDWKAMAYDNEGNTYTITRVKIGSNDRAIGSNFQFDLPKGAPLKMRIWVTGVSDDATEFTLLKLPFRNMDTADPYGAALLQMKHIPIAR